MIPDAEIRYGFLLSPMDDGICDWRMLSTSCFLSFTTRQWEFYWVESWFFRNSSLVWCRARGATYLSMLYRCCIVVAKYPKVMATFMTAVDTWVIRWLMLIFIYVFLSENVAASLILYWSNSSNEWLIYADLRPAVNEYSQYSKRAFYSDALYHSAVTIKLAGINRIWWQLIRFDPGWPRGGPFDPLTLSASSFPNVVWSIDTWPFSRLLIRFN